MDSMGSVTPASPGVEVLDSNGRRVIKKKTRGLKVGYGTLEDPEAPSSVQSPGSFTAAAGAPAAAAANASSLARLSSGSAMSSMNSRAGLSMAGSLQTQQHPQQQFQQQQAQQQLEQQQQQQQHYQQQQQQQQYQQQQQQQQSAVAAAAVRRLNLPGSRARSPPRAVASRVSDPAGSSLPALTALHQERDPGDLISSRTTAGAANMWATQGPAVSQQLQGTVSSASALSGGHYPQQQQQQQVLLLGNSLPEPFDTPAFDNQIRSYTVQASTPPPVSQDTAVGRFMVFLSGLSGTVEACQQRAAAAATDVAQQLAAAVAAFQQQEERTAAALAARRADLATCAEATAVLERQQQAAVDVDDYATAAALDERMQQVAAQVAAVRDAELQLQEAVRQVQARRQELLGQQAQVWEEAAAYLRRLHEGQMAAIAAAAAAQRQELASLEQQQAQVQTAIAEAAAALNARRTELVAARKTVETRSLAASLPLQGEQERLARQQEELQVRLEDIDLLGTNHCHQ